MVCIYCGAKLAVVNSRLQKKSNSTWRRRACPSCQAVITTHETIDHASVYTVKSGKHLEPFSRDKLYISIYEACKHRKAAYRDATALTDTVLGQVVAGKSSVIEKTVLVKMISAVLKRFDNAAATYYQAHHPVLAES